MATFIVRTTLEAEVQAEDSLVANNWAIAAAKKHPELGVYIGCTVFDERGEWLLQDEDPE